MPTATFLTVPNTDDESARTKRLIWATLSPIQRALLATDGSFTLLLQALCGEEIRVKTLNQTTNPTLCPDEILALDAGKELLTRNVILHTPSKRKLIYAQSRIVPERLSRPIIDGLQAGDVPIGIVLRRERHESFRQLVDWGECQLSSQGRNELNEDHCVFRSYLIISSGFPVMQVSEYFSSTLIEAHHG